ncbi:MAG: hypothetical protein IK151_01595 [Erysipelotrichaceae bacterium]|nr:hypothetical protein [Erysipelotrichaceae bacterium]
MKIEIKERGSREYYDELLYVSARRKEIQKNPHKKIESFTGYMTRYNLLAAGSIVFMIVCAFVFNNVIFLFMGITAFILLIIGLISMRNGKKGIEQFLEEKGTKLITIDENGLEFVDNEKNIIMKWDDILNVIVNNYSICFFPQILSNTIISLTKDHLEEIKEALSFYGKSDLLIDNSSLY